MTKKKTGIISLDKNPTLLKEKISHALQFLNAKNIAIIASSASLVLFIIVFALVLQTLSQAQQVQDLRKNIEEVNIQNIGDSGKKTEAEAVLDSLSEIYKLPQEEPTVATIIDAAKLKSEGNQFYKDVQNDDKLIVYAGEQLAIIYRLESKQIINISPISLKSEVE